MLEPDRTPTKRVAVFVNAETQVGSGHGWMARVAQLAEPERASHSEAPHNLTLVTQGKPRSSRLPRKPVQVLK
jgi:hypothetical protein